MENVIKMTPEEIILENEKPVLIVSGDHMVCTPVGGSLEDLGLTGRKIIFDTYDGIFTVKHPIEYGTIMNWTYVEKSGTAFPTTSSGPRPMNISLLLLVKSEVLTCLARTSTFRNRTTTVIPYPLPTWNRCRQRDVDSPTSHLPSA